MVAIVERETANETDGEYAVSVSTEKCFSPSATTRQKGEERGYSGAVLFNL
jgi:hypothetical protein